MPSEENAGNEYALQEMEDEVGTQILPYVVLPDNNFCFTSEEVMEAQMK